MIRLERPVEVRSFDAHATVAVGRQRPEFLAVARLAADLGRPLDGPTLARELLGGLTGAGWRVLDRAISLGLLVRDTPQGSARLSEPGALALQAGVVLVPEERLWRFYMLADPLVDEVLIHVAPVPPTRAQDEQKAIRDAKAGGPAIERRGDTPIDVLRTRAVKGRVWTSVATGALFEVLALSAKGANGPGYRLALTATCAPGGAPTASLRGSFDPPEGARLRVDRDPGVPAACGGLRYDDLWVTLVSAATGVPSQELVAWHQRIGAHVLPAAFDERLTEDARRSFRSTVPLPRPTVAGLGSFDATRLDDLPLVPRSERDATAWAEWLQWSALDRHMTPALLDESRRRVRGMFPCHNPTLASDDQLLRRAASAPTTPGARFLLTPFDLGLWS